MSDRSFNLQRGGGGGGVMVFLFRSEINIRLYDKNSESHYFFQHHWESEYFFRKKKHNVKVVKKVKTSKFRFHLIAMYMHWDVFAISAAHLYLPRLP